jgi:hypothetical protein
MSRQRLLEPLGHPFTVCLLKLRDICKPQSLLIPEDRLSHTVGWLPYLAVPAVRPVARMSNHAGAHHIQIDVHKTAI